MQLTEGYFAIHLSRAQTAASVVVRQWKVDRKLPPWPSLPRKWSNDKPFGLRVAMMTRGVVDPSAVTLQESLDLVAQVRGKRRMSNEDSVANAAARSS